MQNSRPVQGPRSFKNLRFHPWATALLIAALICVSGCGGNSTSSPPPPQITVTVTPNLATVLQGATQPFSAIVTGTSNTAVTWSVEESTGGTIDSAGLYTAPPDSNGTFHIAATSQADAGATGVAAVAVEVFPLTVSPVAVTLSPGGAQTFAVNIAGLTNMSVTWAVQEANGGMITGAGLYTAPSAVGIYHVVATSVENTALTSSAAITVTTSSGGFTPTGSLHEPRGFHSATLLPDGKVLVANGSNSNPQCRDGGLFSKELYDPVAGTFTLLSGEPGFGWYARTATSLQNGEVLLAGGFIHSFDCDGNFSDNTAELYDPVAGSFSDTGNMVAARGGHTATLLMTGKVLLAGGADVDPSGTGLTTAELFDPGTGSFTATGSMAVGRFRHTATLLQSGKVLITGGVLLASSSPTSTAEIYDPATGSFTGTGGMTKAREEHTATLLADGKVLIAGGESPGSGSSDLLPTATAELYDPSTGVFSAAGSMTKARSLHTATLLPSGRVLIAGGGDDNSTAELYDSSTGSFSITGGMEIGRSGHTATLLGDGSVLVAGGGSFAGLATAELYYENGSPWDY